MMIAAGKSGCVSCARFIEDVNAFRDFMAKGIEQIQTDEAQVV
ncbi:MAG: hypothetical protein ACF8OB_16085 [Phycisphaeraceae bacterium JB051]